MRVAGLYAQHGDAVARFVDSMLGTLEAGECWRVRTLVFPVANPVIGALVAEDGRPPVQHASRPDGSFAILDGEIYDGADLPATGASPGSNDAERILALYFSGGQEAIARVDGAGFLTVWDASRDLLLLFRDRSGIVPGYYSERPDGIVWASDIRTLLRTDLPRKINIPAVDFFLANGMVPAPWTLVERINKIPPAYVLRRPAAGPTELRRYWWPCTQPKLVLRDGERTERLAEIFERSLRRRWPSDGHGGVMLSGGVDSKLIVGGLTRWLGARVNTFTFRYTDGGRGGYSEVDEASRAAEHFNTRHHELVYRPSDLVDRLEWMVCSYGEPFVYGLHSCLLRDVVRAGIPVLFNGAGAEWYQTKIEEYGLRYARLPQAVRKLGRPSVALLRRLHAAKRPLWLWRVYAGSGDLADWVEKVMRYGDTNLSKRCSAHLMPDELRARIYSDPSWAPLGRRATEELFATAAKDHAGDSPRDRMTLAEYRFVPSEGLLHWNHWWGRTHGLTIRFPYFANEMVEFVLRWERRDTNKAEFRRLAETLMPRELAYAPRTAQSMPIRQWFRGPLREFVEDWLAPARLEANGLFNVEAVRRLLKEHLRGDFAHEWKLWAILSVVAWDEFVLRRQP